MNPTPDLEAVLNDLERQREYAIRINATAHVADVIEAVLEELRPLVARDENRNEQQQRTDTHLLTVSDVMERMGVKRSYVYDHADQWPFTRRIGRHLRFDPTGLERWLSHR